MKFRLLYTGPLSSAQGTTDRTKPGPKAALKHSMRQNFHRQLRWHWKNNAFLSTHWVYPSDYGLPPDFQHSGERQDRVPLVDALAGVHRQGDFSFVPLVRRDWSLSCELDVLLLRHDPPGSAQSQGDVDNRVKTLTDALTIPKPNQLPEGVTPSKGEVPFFCLMEDDVMLSRLSVESDRLLVEPGGRKVEHQQQVHAVITVNIRPYTGTMFNISFLS